MGFAVRADQPIKSTAEGSRRQKLVVLRPDEASPRALFSAPVQDSAQPAYPNGASKGSSTEKLVKPAEVRQLPKAPRLPLGLKLLVGVQQGSTVLTGGLVATALVIYSWTVYLDKAVSRSFQNLEALKVSTQQVTTANETLKHSIAQQAESPAAGLKPLDPKRVIFLSPAPARLSVAPAMEAEDHSPMPYPLGY